MKKPARKKTARKSDMANKTAEFLKTARQRIEAIPYQPIWEKVRKELKVAVKALGKGTEKAAEKTVTMSRQAGFQYNIYLQSHKLQKLLASLGGRVYDLAKQNPKALSSTDSEVTELIGKISELEKKTKVLKDKARVLKENSTEVQPR